MGAADYAKQHQKPRSRIAVWFMEHDCQQLECEDPVPDLAADIKQARAQQVSRHVIYAYLRDCHGSTFAETTIVNWCKTWEQ